MQRAPDDSLIGATARLLATHPDLTNLELIRRLAAVLGEDVVRRIPVNRFQRQVRDPALKLLRSRGPGAGASRNGTGGRHPTAARWPTVNGNGSEDRGVSGGVAPERVDEALIEAFVLGASWDEREEGVAAFRKLDALRRRLRTLDATVR